MRRDAESVIVYSCESLIAPDWEATRLLAPGGHCGVAGMLDSGFASCSGVNDAIKILTKKYYLHIVLKPLQQLQTGLNLVATRSQPHIIRRLRTF
jgi:hypothetical protein